MLGNASGVRLQPPQKKKKTGFRPFTEGRIKVLCSATGREVDFRWFLLLKFYNGTEKRRPNVSHRRDAANKTQKALRVELFGLESRADKLGKAGRAILH